MAFPRKTIFLRLLVVPVLTLAGVVFALTRQDQSYSRLAGFIAVFVLTVDLLTFVRGRLQNALIAVASIFFGLAVIESVAHTLMPHTVFTHSDGLFGDRSELGWGPIKPGSYRAEKSVNGKQVYAVGYTIDDDLLRKVVSNPQGPTIAFFGDSFTFGDGIEDKDTLPQQFADAVRCFRVLNFGFSAYSPAQMLRALEVGLFDKLLTSPRLFVIQTGPFHVERSACKATFALRGPRYATVDGKLEYQGACTSGLGRRVQEFTSATALDRVFVGPMARRPTHDDVVTYINILAKIERIARETYHVPFEVLYVVDYPHQLDGTGFTDDQVRSELTRLGIIVLDTDVEHRPGDVLRIPGDGHPTGTLNRLLSHKLVDDLRAKTPDVLKCPDRGAVPTETDIKVEHKSNK